MSIIAPQFQRGHLTRYLATQRVTERELRELLLEASRDAERRLLALALKDGIGAQVRSAQLSLVRQEIAGIIGRLNLGVERAVRDGIIRSAETGGDAMGQLTDILFGQLGEFPGIRESFIVQARQGAENLISRGMNNIPLSQQVYRTGAIEQGSLVREINNAIAQGSNWRDLAQTVRKFISPTTPGGVSYAAKRLARTELNNSFHTTQIRLSLKSPFVEGYRWILSGSHPRPDQCNAYADYNGTGIFNKTNVPGKPHPQCLCYLLYETPTVAQFQNRFLNGDYDRYLDELVGEFAPDSLPKLKQKIATRPEPKPEPKRATRKKREPETNEQILDRIRKDATAREWDLEIAKILLEGNTRNQTIRKFEAKFGAFWRNQNQARRDITDRIRRLNIPYERTVKFKGRISTRISEIRQAEIRETLDDFGKRYPERVADLRDVRSAADDAIGYNWKPGFVPDNTYAYYRNGDSTIYLNDRFYASPLTFRASVRAGARDNWHPSNCEHVGSIFDHELGHHLDYGLPSHVRTQMLAELASELGGRQLTKQQILDRAAGLHHNMTGDQFIFENFLKGEAKFKISRYAATNDEELIAELVGEFRAPNQSRYSKIVQRYFDEALGPDELRRIRSLR